MYTKDDAIVECCDPSIDTLKRVEIILVYSSSKDFRSEPLLNMEEIRLLMIVALHYIVNGVRVSSSFHGTVKTESLLGYVHKWQK